MLSTGSSTRSFIFSLILGMICIPHLCPPSRVRLGLRPHRITAVCATKLCISYPNIHTTRVTRYHFEYLRKTFKPACCLLLLLTVVQRGRMRKTEYSRIIETKRCQYCAVQQYPFCVPLGVTYIHHYCTYVYIYICIIYGTRAKVRTSIFVLVCLDKKIEKYSYYQQPQKVCTL